MLLLNGDCLERMTDISDNSIDVCILDLPYGQSQCDWDSKIDLGRLWEQLKRIGKPNTPYFFFTTTRFGCELIRANEKWFRYDLIWEKDKGVGFLNSMKMPMRGHEMIYVFYDKSPFYDIKNNHTKVQEICYEGLNTTTIYNGFQRTNSLWEPRLPKSVLNFGLDKKKTHPTQKPVPLIEWILKYYSRPSDVVLDPTMGSASTAVACHNLGRRFIGIEMDAAIYETAVKRMEALGANISEL